MPSGSRCPTFASLGLRVNNDRWRGVPFLFTAGKGMDERVCELRVRYKAKETNAMMGVEQQNELVMRVQPEESVYMITTAKEPGITAEQLRKPAEPAGAVVGRLPRLGELDVGEGAVLARLHRPPLSV